MSVLKRYETGTKTMCVCECVYQLFGLLGFLPPVLSFPAHGFNLLLPRCLTLSLSQLGDFLLQCRLLAFKPETHKPNMWTHVIMLPFITHYHRVLLPNSSDHSQTALNIHSTSTRWQHLSYFIKLVKYVGYLQEAVLLHDKMSSPVMRGMSTESDWEANQAK